MFLNFMYEVFHNKRTEKEEGKKPLTVAHFVLWKNLDSHPDLFWPEISNIISANITERIGREALINFIKMQEDPYT